jgi:hypothetical protein
MFFQWILDLVVSCEWILQFSSHVWQGYLQEALSFAVFAVCSSSSDKQWMFERRRLIWSLMYSYFFRGRFVSLCLSFVLAFVFLEIYQIWNTHSSVFIKKKWNPASWIWLEDLTNVSHSSTTIWAIIVEPSLPDNFKPIVIGISLSVHKQQANHHQI